LHFFDIVVKVNSFTQINIKSFLSLTQSTGYIISYIDFI